MVSSDNKTKTDQSWPLAAIIAIASLIISAVVFVWLFKQQQMILVGAQDALKDNLNQQRVMQKQYTEFAERIQNQRREEIGFLTKQQFYSALMGLLSQLYVDTKQQDSSALEETLHRINQAYFGLEPFLNQETQQWLGQQIKSMAALSNKLADPTHEYEENLLATKTTLRQMIDETHQKLYPTLFTVKEPVNAKNK